MHNKVSAHLVSIIAKMYHTFRLNIQKGEEISYFQHLSGVHQGDPLTPLLFVPLVPSVHGDAGCGMRKQSLSPSRLLLPWCSELLLLRPSLQPRTDSMSTICMFAGEDKHLCGLLFHCGANFQLPLLALESSTVSSRSATTRKTLLVINPLPVWIEKKRMRKIRRTKKGGKKVCHILTFIASAEGGIFCRRHLWQRHGLGIAILVPLLLPTSGWCKQICLLLVVMSTVNREVTLYTRSTCTKFNVPTFTSYTSILVLWGVHSIYS